MTLLYVGTLSVSVASVYQLPNENSRLIGEQLTYQVEQGDYFQALSEYHNVGFLALIAANPEVDPFLPEKGTLLEIPKQMLLPYAERKGIVINLAELRLYYFPPNESLVYVFPVGIGRQGLSTPRVISYIGDKRKDPTWTPPQEMRERYKKEHGKEMAKVIPAGPDNPFGKYALRLASSEYLIHGTNKRMGIGLRASSGCIRMYAEDIEWLYHNVNLGTQVRIVEQPIKMSYEPDGKKLIEVHKPLTEDENKEKNFITPAVTQFLNNDEKLIKLISQQLQHPNGLVSVLPRTESLR
ncbi:L,D-transpeptidase family protein [Colwellia sp. 1_MG-2023]|uniref:L,D-transpeptidase family protein n=1 Tax=Colwellia sp. 1_MG-2023 TaxID=3062649 RepID=UPI0026E445AD|nr:L,D-transpeptidase family protein [Colwellia sp. 1_MG-2023]MDO6445548.1 L,D-transpeptidase family protein [Colwellia sp. 1_MG-2023]